MEKSNFYVLNLATGDRECDDQNALGGLLLVRSVLQGQIRSEDFELNFGQDLAEVTRNIMDDLWHYLKIRLSDDQPGSDDREERGAA